METPASSHDRNWVWCWSGCGSPGCVGNLTSAPSCRLDLSGSEEARDAALMTTFSPGSGILCHGCRDCCLAGGTLGAHLPATEQRRPSDDFFCVASPSDSTFSITGCRPAGLCGSWPAFQGCWSRATLSRCGCIPGSAAPARADGEVLAWYLFNGPRIVKQPALHAVLSWSAYPGGGGTGACYRRGGATAGKPICTYCC